MRQLRLRLALRADNLRLVAQNSKSPATAGPFAIHLLEQTLSVVIPVFRGGDALQDVVEELLRLAGEIKLTRGVFIRLDEVVLVCDNPWFSAVDRKRLINLEASDPRVRIVWLTRNFGQHAATVAGVVSTAGDWVATMDEDGQHDPVRLPDMFRTAAEKGNTLVYAKPTNPPPHGLVRNAASRVAKNIFSFVSGMRSQFHSFRLIEGAVARSACAYMGQSVYLDVALGWSCGDSALCPMEMRSEGSKSAYNYRRLFAHFARMVLSFGARPLRMIAAFGVLIGIGGLGFAAFVIERRIVNPTSIPIGWASEFVALLMLFAVLFVTLAIIAEYLSFAAGNTIGKPLYVIAEPPASRALWVLQEALTLAEQEQNSVDEKVITPRTRRARV